MDLSISFPAFHYKKAYLGTLVISKEANGVKLYIKSDEVATFKVIFGDGTEKGLEVPISSLGTYAVKTRYGALRDALAKWSRNRNSENSKGENTSGIDSYPILFTFNENYGTPVSMRRDVKVRDIIKVAVLSGVAACVKDDYLKGRSEAENTYLLIIRSYPILKTEAGWKDTKCSDKRKYSNEERWRRCWFYSFIIIDKCIRDRLTGIVEDQKDQKKVRYEVEIETTSGDSVHSVHSDTAELDTFSLRDVRAFLRSFPLIRLESLECSNSMLELCRGDLEYIHVGSQITARRPGYYFISPVIISYPMDMPKNPSQGVVALPQDKIFNTGVVKFSIKDFAWNKAVKLVDWLWVKRRDALFKLLLNEEVITAIEQFIKRFGNANYRNCRHKRIGFFTNTELYGNKIIIYSPSVRAITGLYHSIKVSSDSHGSGSDYIISVVAQVMDKLFYSTSGSKCGSVEGLLQEHKDDVKKILSVFAIAYGLHGVSHLLMKALTALTGITDYTEFIRVEVETHGGQDIELKEVLENSGFQEGVYLENLFEIIPGDNFDLNVYVISREPYSYAIYRDRLVDGSSGQLKLDDIKAVLRKLISYETSQESKDACEVRWKLEQDLLSPYRNILKSSNQNVYSRVDNIVENYLKDRFKPPRSLFRYLYASHIRDEIRQGNIAVNVKEIDTNIQYIWPYHLPQCIDGCYGCVLMERSISSRTCDLSPLVQELKVSKWSALCLLKYAGLIDEPWVDCKLT